MPNPWSMLTVLALVLGCAANTPHPTREAAPEPMQHVERVDPPWVAGAAAAKIVYAVPGMEQATATKDVVYKRAAPYTLALDVWSPKQAAPRPAIVFVHGGPVPDNLRTEPKDWSIFQSYGQLAAASGFVGITFNHRLYGLDKIADAYADVIDLVQHVQANAAKYGVDPDRICLWAFSGGGALVAAAFGNRLPGVRCVVSFYGVLDRRPQRKAIPASISDATLQELSPVYRVAAGHPMPPMLIGRAGKDAPEINATVDDFVREAKARNAPVQVIEHPTGQHAFDVRDDDDRSREIIAEAVKFIALHTAAAK
jgi:acetyl esterase/lipase